MKRILLLLLLLTFALSAHANVLHVSPSGADANSGQSWALAKKTIQAALTAAASGDEIWVREGTYVENITHKRGVGLYGGFAGTETEFNQRSPASHITILDGGNLNSTVTFPSNVSNNLTPPLTILDGFTVRNGNANSGIYVGAGSPVIRNCAVINNNGPGITLVGSASAAPQIVNCRINDNANMGLYINGGSPVITDNTINHNTGVNGGGIYIYSGNTPVIARNTITNNVANDHNGGGIYSKLSTLTITDCTLSGNRSSSGYGGGVFGSALTLTHCAVNGNAASSGGGGIYSADNLTITDCAVNNNGVTSFTVGVSGGGIMTGGTVNVTHCTFTNNAAGINSGKGGSIYTGGILNLIDSTFSGNYSTTIVSGSATVTHCSFVLDSLQFEGSGTFQVTDCDFSNLNGITYRGSGSLAVSDCDFSTQNGAANHLILDGSGSTSIQNCTMIGKYNNSNGAGIRSHNAGPITVSHCQFRNNEGGGIEAQATRSLTVTDCEFVGNRSSSPGNSMGGIYARVERLTVLRNIFRDNKGDLGSPIAAGGITSLSQGTTSFALIADNLIVRNESPNQGGLYCQGYALVANNTIANNTSSSVFAAGGAYLEPAASDTIRFINNVVAFNSSGMRRGGNFSLVENHNCIGNNRYFDYDNFAPAATDILDNPFFMDVDNPDITLRDYRLSPDSPCINAGDNSVVQAGDLDLDHATRIRGSAVDIGGYEYRPPVTVSGHIQLEECQNPNGAFITFTFLPTAGATFERIAALDVNGDFVLTEIPSLAYNALHIKGAKWLAKNLSLNTINGDVSGVTALLKSGDANNDNFVDVFDLDPLIQAFNTLPGDGSWNVGADFNCDDSVDVFDLDILIRNFNIQGEE